MASGNRMTRQKLRSAASVLGIGAMSLAVSGCAVGPNFSPADKPDVTGYVKGNLAPGRPRKRAAVRARSAFP